MRCRRDGAIGTRQQRPYNGPNTKPSPVDVGRDRLPFVLTCRFCGCPPYGTTLSGYSKNLRPAAGLCVLFDGGFLRRYALARASEPASCRGTQRAGGAGVGRVGWGGRGIAGAMARLRARSGPAVATAAAAATAAATRWCVARDAVAARSGALGGCVALSGRATSHTCMHPLEGLGGGTRPCAAPAQNAVPEYTPVLG